MNPAIHNGGDRDDIIPAFTVAYPNLLIRNMKRIGLTSAEFVFVSYLTSGDFSWQQNCVVASSLKEMHRATGLATGTIHKAKSGLVKKGLVQS